MELESAKEYFGPLAQPLVTADGSLRPEILIEVVCCLEGGTRGGEQLG
jgi:hypothetical protein